MKIFKKLFINLKNVFIPKHSNPQTVLNVKKIKFGYDDKEIHLTFFISNDLNEIFKTPIISEKDLKKLITKLNEIKTINEIQIDPLMTINDNPLIKVIRMNIKL
jgi:hypothetical protein